MADAVSFMHRAHDFVPRGVTLALAAFYLESDIGLEEEQELEHKPLFPCQNDSSGVVMGEIYITETHPGDR